MSDKMRRENVIANKRINFMPYLALVLMPFTYNSILDAIIMSIIVIYVLLNKDIDKSIYIYVFLLPWEQLFTIPLVGSMFTIIQIIICIKLVLLNLNGQQSYRTRFSELVFIMVIAGYAFIGLLIHNSIQGLGILLDVFIIFNIIAKYRSGYDSFWENIFSIVIFSTICTCLFGLLHMQFIDRWIGGIGFVKIYYGILGTTRSAIYINIALLFTFVLNIERKLKICIIIFLYAFLLMTTSMTGIIVNVLMIAYCFAFNVFNLQSQTGVSLLKRFAYIVVLFIGIVAILQLEIAQPVVQRIENITSYIEAGEVDKAVSGREGLSTIYLNVFNEYGMINKLVGVAAFNTNDLMNNYGIVIPYSHNSFIDLLLTFGILGEIYIMTHMFIRNLRYRKNKYFKVVMGLKIIIIVSGLTVSMVTTSFWTFWLLI
ncbi:MAG: hypothetical protein PHH31_05150 [Acidaminococcaceae bacterium]|nr:hypothetical protein [Acidaminococcaceae bacterium]